MSELRIGEVARLTGLRASAIRYYEERKLITPSRRAGGKRVYEANAVERLALIAFAKNAGFSLEEIRVLLFGFPPEATAGTRWSQLADAKLVELDAMTQRIETMRAALQKIRGCGCADLDQCARGIASHQCAD